jgi:hypothetical protein
MFCLNNIIRTLSINYIVLNKNLYSLNYIASGGEKLSPSESKSM